MANYIANSCHATSFTLEKNGQSDQVLEKVIMQILRNDYGEKYGTKFCLCNKDMTGEWFCATGVDEVHVVIAEDENEITVNIRSVHATFVPEPEFSMED